MKRKQPVYKGLQFKPVWFEDTSLTSPEYLQITEFPTRLTAGKNLFKLRGHPTNLRIDGLVNLEILDYNGNPIFHEVVDYLDDDKSRVVSIYIYEDTPAGDCTITILTEAVNVPAEWKDRYNIRWTRSVPINPNISNSSEIIFENEPTLIINEQIGPHLNRVYSSGIQFPTYNTGTVRYFLYNKTPAIEIIGGKFSGDMVNGTITITSPVNATPTPNFPPATTQYSSTIKKVLSDSLILLDTDYTVYSNKSLSTHTFNSFDSSTFNLTYEQTPSYIATQNSESYALIEITGLEPATGDVSRIKMYMNNKGTVGTWEPINDIELGETEIFVNNTSSLYPDQSIGLFTSQSIIDTYWYGFTYLGKTVGTAPTLTWNTSSLNNAMYIQNNTDISAKNAVTVIKSTIGGTFIEDSGYKIVFDALGIRTTGDPKIAIYLSGSAFSYDSTDYFNQEFPEIMGKRIGELTVKTNNQRFDDIKFNFKAANTGTATLILVVESGDWKISDIRTTSDNDIGYTPNYTRIKTLVPTAHKINNQLSFKAEYYNINGERSKQISYYYNKDWEGGNRYIDGNYSMLTGSLYVADSLNSGVAISGYPDSGFVRSLGYEGFEAGFPGFLLWSGSAMPNSLGTKGAVSYSGVGLELYANPDNYFRYATNPSELDVHTQTFFLGSTSPANFISGSNGKLQISSSNFNISAEGDVTASDATFRGNSTADFYQWRNVVIAETAVLGEYNNISLYLDDITNKYYCSLNLTGSYDPALAGYGPSIFTRINELPSAPIAAIKIHPDSWNTGGRYQKYGGFVILESAGSGIYLQLSNGSGVGELSGLLDANIGYDDDDWFKSALKTVSINGDFYSDCLELKSGTRVMLTQGMFDWRILSITSYNGIIPDFYSGIKISSGSISVTGSLRISGSQTASPIRIAIPSGSAKQNYSVPLSQYQSFSYNTTTRPWYTDQYIYLGYDSSGTDPELTILTDPSAGRIQACVFSTSTGTSTITDVNEASGVTDIWTSGIGSDERLDITLSAGADTTYPFYKITMFRSNITHGGNVHCVVERYFTDL